MADPGLAVQLQQQAMQQQAPEWERMRQEQDRKAPLEGYQKYAAELLHDLVFGQTPVEQVVQRHIANTRGGGAPSMQAPQGAPPRAAPGVTAGIEAAFNQTPPPVQQPQQQMPLTHAGFKDSINSMDNPEFPTSTAPLYGGAVSPMTPTMGLQQDTGAIQGGLRQAQPMTSTALSPTQPMQAQQAPTHVGPDGRGAPRPQTRGDFEALMNLVHSGIPGAMMRTADLDKRLTTQERIAAENRASREGIASAGNETKKGIAADTEAGRSERAQLNAETRRQIASDAMFEAHRKATLEHMDRVAAIAQRANAVSERINAALEKGDSSELNAAEKELHEAESELKTEVGAQTKFSGQAAQSLTPDQQKRAQALSDAAQPYVDAARKKIADAQKKLDEAKANKKNKVKSSASVTTKSGGGALPPEMTVLGKDGLPIKMVLPKGVLGGK